MANWNDYPINYNKHKKLPKGVKDIKDVRYLMDERKSFEEALGRLKTRERETCQVSDSNICVYSDYDNAWGPITPKCFNSDLSMQRINKSYSVIKKYMGIQNNFQPYPGIPVPTPLFHEYAHKHPGENDVRFLYDLTLGDDNTLINFAKICYFVCRTPFILNRPIVILANKGMHKEITQFFSELVRKKTTQLSLNDLLRNGKLVDLYVDGLNFRAVNIATLGDIPKSERSVYRIKSLLKGEKLTITNPYFSGKLYIKNRIPFIFITDNHRRYTAFKQLFDAYDLAFKEQAVFDFANCSLEWFRIRFTELGEKWYLSRKGQYLHTVDGKDEIVRAFVRDICSVKPDEECEKSALYNAYCRYYKCYYSGEPLKPITFGKKIMEVSGCHDFRRHLSTKSYPWFFDGIGISPRKWKRFLEKENIPYRNSYDSLYKFIIGWCDEKVETQGLYVAQPTHNTLKITEAGLRFALNALEDEKQSDDFESQSIQLPELIPPEYIKNSDE